MWAVEALKEWHDFYVLVGTAGATLLALLFVAVSLGTGFLTAVLTHPSTFPILYRVGIMPLLSGKRTDICREPGRSASPTARAACSCRAFMKRVRCSPSGLATGSAAAWITMSPRL